MVAQAKNVVSRWRLAAVKTMWVRGGERQEYLDAVWEMYRLSYAKIGLHVSGASGLLKYDQWELFFDGDTPIAFSLYQTTSFGLKTGLVGTDGSPAAKGAIKSYIKSRFNRGNVYGEVSHAVERLTQGVSTVCAVDVSTVLKKPVVPEEDGVHYQRALKGVGMVTKKLVGNPKGVPSGPEGACELTQRPGTTETLDQARVAEDDQRTADERIADERIADELDAAEHACCQATDYDD